MKKLFLFLAAGAAAWVSAQDYQPVREGLAWTYAYRAVMTHPMLGTNIYESRIHSRFEGTEELAGQIYHRLISSYDNLFGLTGGTSYYRIAETGVYCGGYDAAGQFRETLMLPARLEVGQRWDYNDGVASTQRVESIGPVVVGGVSYSNAALVARDISGSQGEFRQRAWYVPGVGEVKWVFRQDNQGMISETTRTLESMERGAGP